jgi:WD40 repeat protein
MFKYQQTLKIDNVLEVRGVGYALEVRDTQTKKVKTRILGLDSSYKVFSPNGKLVSTQYARILNARSRETWANVPGDNTSAVFSPDSKTLAVGHRDGSITLYDPIRLRETPLVKSVSSGEVVSLAYRPDEMMLASVGRDTIVRFWDIKTGKQLYTHERGTLALGRVQFSADDKLIAATGNRSLYVWDTTSGQRYVAQHIKEVKPEEQWIYWDTTPVFFSPYLLSFSPDGTAISTLNTNDQVSVWDSQTGHFSSLHKIIPGGSIYFAGDRTIFTATDKQVQRFDLTSASTDVPVQKIDFQFEWPIDQMAVSGDSSTIAISDSKQVQIWDLKKSTKKATVFLANNFFVYLALNADGTRLAIARQDGGIEIWDLQPQRKISQVEISGYLDNWVVSVNVFPIPMAFSPDGGLLVVGSSVSGQLYFFDAANGRQLRIMSLHRNGITDLQFNADSTQLASVGLDGAVFIVGIVDQMAF